MKTIAVLLALIASTACAVERTDIKVQTICGDLAELRRQLEQTGARQMLAGRVEHDRVYYYINTSTKSIYIIRRIGSDYCIVYSDTIEVITYANRDALARLLLVD